MSKAIFCLVVVACVWILAPALHAGDETRPVRFSQQQWRIFPHAPFRRAADTEITARLTRQIEPLAAFFQPDRNNVRFETLGDSLLEAKARNQFFRLESLLRLYGRAFPDFEKYRVSVKEIEDGLGAYSYAVDSLSFAEDKFKKENRSRGLRCGANSRRRQSPRKSPEKKGHGTRRLSETCRREHARLGAARTSGAAGLEPRGVGFFERPRVRGQRATAGAEGCPGRSLELQSARRRHSRVSQAVALVPDDDRFAGRAHPPSRRSARGLPGPGSGGPQGFARGQSPVLEPGAQLSRDASVHDLALPPLAGRQDDRRDRPLEGCRRRKRRRRGGAGHRPGRCRVEQQGHARGDRAC